LIHLKVAIEHAQNGPFKIIFVAIGTFELGSALATALWPSRSVYALVAVATAILVTSWVVWHTVGLPVPTQTWEPEPSSLWNSLALVSDAIMAESAAILFWSSRRRSSLHWQTRQGPGRATSERSAGLSTGHGHQWLHGVGKPADVEKRPLASAPGRSTVFVGTWVWTAPQGRGIAFSWRWDHRIGTAVRSIGLGLMFVAAVGFFLVGGFGPHIDHPDSPVSEAQTGSPQRAAKHPRKHSGPVKQNAKGKVVTDQASPSTPIQGALLKTLRASVAIPGSATMDCHRLGELGWTVTCGVVGMSGGKVAWVVQRQPAPDSCCSIYVIRVYTYLALARGWVARLQQNTLRGLELEGADVVNADLTGDGKPELLVGARFPGSGNTVTYDIVTYRAGYHPQLGFFRWVSSEGSVTLGTRKVNEYEPIYSEGQICCPEEFSHRVIQWTGSAFRTTLKNSIDSDSVPQSIF
jgi:hypothetical protein